MKNILNSKNTKRKVIWVWKTSRISSHKVLFMIFFKKCSKKKSFIELWLSQILKCSLKNTSYKKLKYFKKLLNQEISQKSIELIYKLGVGLLILHIIFSISHLLIELLIGILFNQYLLTISIYILLYCLKVM